MSRGQAPGPVPTGRFACSSRDPRGGGTWPCIVRSGRRRGGPPPSGHTSPASERSRMAVKPEQAKAALVEKAIAQVRERLPEAQADEVARFVRDYYAEAPPEDLGEL